MYNRRSYYGSIYTGAGVNTLALFNLATGAATTVSSLINREYEGALTSLSLQIFSVD